MATKKQAQLTNIKAFNCEKSALKIEKIRNRIRKRLKYDTLLGDKNQFINLS